MAYGAPYMSQLPKHRVEGDKAFSAYGIDFMGPLFLKPPEGDGESKSYVALITCCSTHLTDRHMDKNSQKLSQKQEIRVQKALYYG